MIQQRCHDTLPSLLHPCIIEFTITTVTIIASFQPTRD